MTRFPLLEPTYENQTFRDSPRDGSIAGRSPP